MEYETGVHCVNAVFFIVFRCFSTVHDTLITLSATTYHLGAFSRCKTNCSPCVTMQILPSTSSINGNGLPYNQYSIDMNYNR